MAEILPFRSEPDSLLPLGKRVEVIALEAIASLAAEIDYPVSAILFRQPPCLKSRGSRVWVLSFWFKGDQALDLEVEITPYSTDASIREEMLGGLTLALDCFGLRHKLPPQKLPEGDEAGACE